MIRLNSKNLSVVLNTQSFTKEEVETMAIELSKKFNLNCSTRTNKGKQIIVIDHSSYYKILKLIKPFLNPEMEYKLPSFSEQKTKSLFNFFD